LTAFYNAVSRLASDKIEEQQFSMRLSRARGRAVSPKCNM
jgi:hypothetical protein